MIEKPLEQIAEADLQTLVTQQRAEGKRLDYKLTLPGGSDKDTKEFLADVTSFANSDGGDLILGMRERGGAASELVGVPADGLEEAIHTIENKVRTAIEPRLPGFHVQPVPLANGHVALVLRITASLIAPHRVSYKSSGRFHARNSKGKYPMDMSEIRLSFAATDEMPRKVRELHDQAIRATSGQDMPVALVSGPKAIVTVAPMSVLREGRDLTITRDNAVLPVRDASNHFVVSLDGLIVHSVSFTEGKTAQTWAVNHRRGYVDFAWSIQGNLEKTVPYIHGPNFEKLLVGAAISAFAHLRQHGLEGQWITMVSLREIGGCRLQHPSPHGFEDFSEPAWLDNVYLGDVVSDTVDLRSLKPLIERFWRVFGLENRPPMPSHMVLNLD